MVAHTRNLVRVSLTLDPIDVDLLDRLAALEGLNRSAELRGLLAQARPMLRQTVEAFEAAAKQRSVFNSVAANLEISKLQELAPEIDKIHDSYMGAVARLEGLAAFEESKTDTEKPPAGNTGVTNRPHTLNGDEK